MVGTLKFSNSGIPILFLLEQPEIINSSGVKFISPKFENTSSLLFKKVRFLGIPPFIIIAVRLFRLSKTVLRAETVPKSSLSVRSPLVFLGGDGG
jgi:hypothetical protein